jgi:hypothetical protein
MSQGPQAQSVQIVPVNIGYFDWRIRQELNLQPSDP